MPDRTLLTRERFIKSNQPTTIENITLLALPRCLERDVKVLPLRAGNEADVAAGVGWLEVADAEYGVAAQQRRPGLVQAPTVGPTPTGRGERMALWSRFPKNLVRNVIICTWYFQRAVT